MTLAYPDFDKEFEIYTDASQRQLGAVITQRRYMHLPMGIADLPDIFQERMSGLMENLEYVRMYIDDLLILSGGIFDNHLLKLQEVLD